MTYGSHHSRTWAAAALPGRRAPRTERVSSRDPSSERRRREAKPLKSGLEIAQEAVLRPITDVAADAGILDEELEQYGRFKGKISLSIIDRLADRPDGKLVITTAITPTKAGEGKTTTSISLTQGMGLIGKDVMLCLREPSMGPVFGIKGGGNGGGYAQVVPMEEINLHFNGDFHAVQAAHNLLAAALDASIYHGNPLGIDPVTVSWPRTLDMNDRELRYSVVGLGGKAHGVPRENQFVITAASEIMAVLALASDLPDLRARLGRIVVASTYEGTGDGRRSQGRGRDDRDHEGGHQAEPGPDTRGPARADPRRAVRQHRAREQLDHRGPHRVEAGRLRHHRGRVRAAISASRSSATSCAGRAASRPRRRVLVTTVRATKSHGGCRSSELAIEDLDAVRRGIDNLAAHIGIVRRTGCLAWSDQQLPHGYREGDRSTIRSWRVARRRNGRREHGRSQKAAQAPSSSRRPSSRRARSRTPSTSSRRTALR